MLYCRHSFTAYFPGISEDYNKPVNPKENDRIYQMEQRQRSYERNMRKWDRERRVKAAAGLDTTKEDYWYKYNKMRLKELVDASNGYLKRDYSAEKIGGTKGRPYKPVRRPKKRVTTKVNAQVSDKETNTDIPKYEVLCNIDSSKYKAPEGSSSKVILMDERKKHIKESHPEAVDAIVKNLPSILTDPDAVYIENGKENTRWVVKKLDDHNAKITLKLSTGDNEKFHSIITGQFMRSKQIEKAENKGRITRIYFKGDQEYTVSEEKPKVEE